MQNYQSRIHLIFFSLIFILSACGGGTSGTSNNPLEISGYYVAKTGSNENSGTLLEPFLTIQHCAKVIQPGETCVIREGTYRETITPDRSGIASAPIKFETYPNEIVLISGADIVDNFEASQNNNYKAAVNWDLGMGKNQLFVDGKMLFEARYPNADRGVLESSWGKVTQPVGAGENWTFKANNLPQDLINANINIIPGPAWVAETGKVTAASVNTITFKVNGGQLGHSPSWSPTLFNLKTNNPYYAWGKLALLDSPQEFFHDGSSVYINRNPAGHDIELKKRDFAFDLRNRSFIEIKGFHIFAATVITGSSPVNANSNNIILDDVHLRYLSHYNFITPGQSWSTGIKDSGVILFGNNHILRNCSIAYSAGNGITLAGKNHIINNNIIHHTNYTATDTAAIVTGWYNYLSDGHIIENNTLFDSGRSLLLHRNTTNVKIRQNHLYRAGHLTQDLGITYTFNTDGTGTEIAYNVMHDNLAENTNVGIYLDNNSHNFLVHHNLTWNTNIAFQLNLPAQNNQVYNNTLIGDSTSIDSWPPNQSEINTKLYNNILVGTRGSSVPTTIDEHSNIEGIDPHFINAANHIYSLSSSSPAIDAGIEINGITNGFSGSSPDIGAIEYNQTRSQAGTNIVEPCVHNGNCKQ